jgi:S1-C subfamily serine protease
LHVVEGASRGYAKAVGQKPKHNIEGIVGVDTDRDLVLLKVSGAHGVPLWLGNSDGIEVGETVYAMGNPQGLEGTFSQGIVSGVREVGTDRLLQITAPISPGSSGGPVLNVKGEAIGVSVATFKGGQNLNFAIPSNYLKRLLANPSTLAPLGGLKTSPGRESILGDSGGRSTEGVVGENLTYDASAIPSGAFSFSLVNKLRDPVRNIAGLIVFHDMQGNPLDVATFTCREIIPGGLAKRVKGWVDGSVEKLNNPTPAFPYVPAPPRRPQGKIEIRVLDFQIGD